MKLKTKMEGSCVYSRGYDIDSANISPLEVARLKHDVTAAHAILMAMELWDNCYSKTTVGSIKKRADEIMRRWGYYDGHEDEVK
jgi:hypothetical protein